MKAQNLAICVPNKGCNKNCPYCISKITPPVKTNWVLMERNISKVRKFAERAGISSVVITGKGEPLLNTEHVLHLLKEFKDFPCELQTNGIILKKWYLDEMKDKDEFDLFELDSYIEAGLNVIALSYDKLADFDEMGEVTKWLNKRGFVVRVTLNVTDLLPNSLTWEVLVENCKVHHIHQLSLRRVSINREANENNPAVKWIKKHTTDLYYILSDQLHDKHPNLPFQNKMLTLGAGRLIRVLPYGARMYDIEGIAVTTFDYCLQDSHNNDDIRSLIFQEDGHLYTSWGSPASILF